MPPTDAHLNVASKCDSVSLQLKGATAEEVLKELWAPMFLHPHVKQHEQAWLALIARQAAAPVSISAIVALPHARTSAVSQIVIAGGRHENGVKFDNDHPQIRLIILVVTPPDLITDYLATVAGLSRRLRNGKIVSALLAAPDEATFNQLLFGLPS